MSLDADFVRPLAVPPVPPARARSGAPAALPWARSIAGGLALAAGLAALAFLLRRVPGLGSVSPLIIGLMLGVAVGNAVRLPGWAKPGLAFAMRRLLRAGIVLLGLQITLAQIAGIGLAGFAVIAATLAATFVFTVQAGRLLKVDPRLAQLIAAGTSVCGASAVIAANSAARGSDEDVAYAVATVTIFGSLAMVVYPLLPDLAGLSPQAYGLWTGASIHEVAQVVAAGFQHGDAAGQPALVAKLCRVLLLAPLVVALGLWVARRDRAAGAATHAPAPPLFVAGFLAMVVLASTGALPQGLRDHAPFATQLLLTVALAAMGLSTSLRRLCRKGFRPLALGLASSLFISLFSLALVRLVPLG